MLKTQGVREDDKPLLRALAHRMHPRCSVPEYIHWMLIEECRRKGLTLAEVTAEGEALKDDTDDAGTGSTG